jgi:hypothetical protein
MLNLRNPKMASNLTRPNVTEETPSYESLETRYVRMIVESNEIPWKFNALASAANWILLAGYLVVPGTFTSLQKSDTLSDDLAKNVAGNVLLNTIQNPPLLAISCLFFVLGSVLIGWLFSEYKGNYIWLINRLFM